jgi:hypothetical protein
MVHRRIIPVKTFLRKKKFGRMKTNEAAIVAGVALVTRHP